MHVAGIAARVPDSSPDGPVIPVMPVAPVIPVAPVAPGGPVAPVAPGGPCAPAGPAGPGPEAEFHWPFSRNTMVPVPPATVGLVAVQSVQ